MKLFNVAIPDLASGPMTLPDQRRVMRFGVLLHCKDKWCVPAPPIGSGHAHTAFEQIHGGLASHAAAFRDIVRASVRHSCTRVHNHDLERGKCVADTLELGFD